ncbi:MAG: alpha-L-fucosidase [Dehalococcoidia bacterium]
MADWFEAARFGMFVHWGHSSQQGCELSWPMVGGVGALPEAGSMSVEDYQRSAATFDPQAFDARGWARLAKSCGMQYAVLTAKHHDGFSMFHTKLSDFSIQHAPCGRDIVREFAEAMRAEGLRVGLYFSLIDWHHPDYPAFETADQPYKWLQWRQPTAEQWARYVDFMFGQVRELLTDYGRIDVIWFDGGWERTPQQWKSQELEQLIRSLQPEILINDRLPGFGDYETPEQFIPAKPPARAWETCMTMNESWGYNPRDKKYKSSRQLVHTLCEVAGKGGNLLLNVSPTGDGAIPPEQTERLEAAGGWMARHQESIVGTAAGLEPWQFYGPTARRDDRVYLHLLMRPYEEVAVRGVRTKRVRRVTALSDGRELAFRTRCSVVDTLINPDPLGELTIVVPDEVIDALATVVAVDFEGSPV